MKIFYTLLAGTLIAGAASAQCLTISCNSNTTVNNDPGQCGAVVTYPTPVVLTNTCSGTQSDTFQYTGTQQTFVVPPGITSVTIKTWGAQGGANWVNNTNFGGYVAADYAVTPGTTLYVYVGGQATSTVGGFNGGGSGEGAGKGGGGGSDVRIGGTTYADRIVCAGGGGGAGYWSNLHVVGGQGGGLTGGNGYRDPSYATNPGGQGASQSGGGPDGTCVNFNVTACAGGFGYGGSITGCGCEVYGGGGGWYGGAASGNCRGGGGGSGNAVPTATNVVMNTGVRAGNGMVVISYAVVSSSGTVTQTAGLASGANFPVGTTVNTFIGSDGFGNTDTCTFSVTVVDNEAPVITSYPASVGTPATAGQCGGTMSWTAPVASDNCSATISSTANSGDFFPVGVTTVTLIASDPSGNSDTVSFTVTMVDTEAPVITNVPAGITQSNDIGQCGAIVTWPAPSALDNCSGLLVTASANPGDFFPVGTTTVTYIATDSSGNSDTASFTVTVTDTELPTAQCPGNITVSADPGMCSASNVSLGSISVTDNCTTTVTNDAPPVFPVGSTTVTYTVTDAGGNTTTCTQLVTVNDSEAPVLSACPQDVFICPGVVQYAPPAATDNCGATVSLVSGPASGSTLTAGSYTVVYSAVDSAGNGDTCTFIITVNSNPVITTNNPNIVCVNDGSYTLNGSPAGGTWSGTAVASGMFSPATAGNGTFALTYNYTDANGCSATGIDTITVAPCTGITEAGATTFSMFPNPASEFFTFNSAENGVMEMFDVNGQIVLSKSISAARTEINTTELAAGTYLVRFTSVSGIVSTGQLQIQR